MSRKNTSLAIVMDSRALGSSPRGSFRSRQRRSRRPAVAAASASFPSDEEVLVIDARATVRPAQVVENKLTRLLQEASVPVSHLQMRGLLRIR